MSQQNIEWLPPGTKITKIRMMDQNSVCGAAHVGLEPDNVYDVFLDDVVIPEGYERAGDKPEEWFRTLKWGVKIPDMDLFYLDYVDNAVLSCRSGVIFHKSSTEDTRRIILRNVKRTKRVLVAEWDIDESRPDYQSSSPNFDHPDSMAFTVTRPARHRIEEREETNQEHGIRRLNESIKDETSSPVCVEHEWQTYTDTQDICRRCNAVRGHSQTESVKFPPTIGRTLQPVAFDLLSDFAHFCASNPDSGFWQALAFWSGAKAIEYVPYIRRGSLRVPNRDTFHWKGRNG